MKKVSDLLQSGYSLNIINNDGSLGRVDSLQRIIGN
jgi:hypothetical protein